MIPCTNAPRAPTRPPAYAGPVESAFTVFADFVHYKSGVYAHKQGAMLGGHAVKIIGYGTDPVDGPYWIIVSHPTPHRSPPQSAT